MLSNISEARVSVLFNVSRGGGCEMVGAEGGAVGVPGGTALSSSVTNEDMGVTFGWEGIGAGRGGLTGGVFI